MQTSPTRSRVRRISYDTAQRVVMVTGVAILLGLALLLYFTRVDPIEVWAVLFYLPVFVAFMIWGTLGGSATGLAAAIVYVAIRYPSLHAVQGRDLFSLLLARAVGYVAFGAIGGWASSELGGSIRKLNRYDTIDDDTGLLNARQFVVEVERQVERAQRYGTTFSVVVSELDLAPEPGPRRQVRNQLSRLGDLVRGCIRQVDSAAHSSDGSRHRFAVLLPDTTSEGGAVFAARMKRSLEAEPSLPGEPFAVTAASYTQNPDTVMRVMESFRADDLRQNGPREGAAK